MAFIKHSDGKIGHVVESDEEIDNEKTSKILKDAKEEAKNVSKDGNKTELVKESE